MYRRVGLMVEMCWQFNQANSQRWTAGKLPSEFCPYKSFLEPAVLTFSNGIVSNNTAEVEVRESGEVNFICAASVDGGRNIGHSVWIARQ